MKTAVVYYSLDGSTRIAAQVIAQRLNAELYELKEKKTRGKTPAAFMGEAFAAVFGIKSRLQDTFAVQMEDCERICIGTPIWASRPVPAVNTFAASLAPKGKQVLLFTVQADPNPDPSAKGAAKLIQSLRKKGAEILPVLQLHGEAPGKTATKEHMEEQIIRQLESLLQSD
jgi:flavodoxin